MVTAEKTTNLSSPKAVGAFRKVVLASVMVVSAGVVAVSASVPAIAAGSVLGAAIGITALAIIKLQASRKKAAEKAREQVIITEQHEMALQLFAASMFHAQREKQGYLIPEHDMRSEEQKMQNDESSADLDKQSEQAVLAADGHDNEEIFAIRVTHPYASSMVH